ncbi:WhiB family transcriptional regulator [Glycomyces sp. MUSA5-2]|uniref:WhiB family transcriptional regulator n=1 Tax=Glycomyces sp. MUSA5-2 TaxID=2053002 RepID=UPI003009F148
MSDKTVQALAAIGAAEAEHDATALDDLMVAVAVDGYCQGPGLARIDEWAAPPASHEHMPQHRYEERVAMVAKRVCAPCPVQTQCLVAALRLPRYYENWIRGGLTPAQRAVTFDDAIATAGEGR